MELAESMNVKPCETWEQACEMEKDTGNGKGTSARDSDLQEGEMCFQSHNGTDVHSAATGVNLEENAL